MGLASNTNEKFMITEDATIIRRSSDALETSILNIIRVGASKADVLAAYDAQKRSYEVCKSAGRADYKEYVETLQLDHYPNELKKAELGKKYLNAVWWLIAAIVLGLAGFVTGAIFIYFGLDWWPSIDETDFFGGIVTVILTSIIVFPLIKFILRKMISLKSAIIEI